MTWRVWLAMAGGVGLFLVLLGLIDWLRPAESRSHLGRFVQTALDGGAWDVIARKLAQNATLFFSNPLSLLIPVVLAIFAYALARPSWWAAAPLRRPFEEIPLLRPGLIAVMILWVLGFALNDSGAAIPAVGATIACPLVIAIAIRTFDDEWEARPLTNRASR